MKLFNKLTRGCYKATYNNQMTSQLSASMSKNEPSVKLKQSNPNEILSIRCYGTR